MKIVRKSEKYNISVTRTEIKKMPIDLSSRDLKEQFLNQKQIRELFFSGFGGFNMKKNKKKQTFSNKHVTIYCKVIYTIQ